MPDWKCTLQHFPVNLTRELSPPSLAIVSPTPLAFERKVSFDAFAGFGGSASGIYPIAAVHNWGCNATDYVNVKANTIALVKRGNCSFAEKAAFASAAQASAVVIYNDGSDSAHQGVFVGSAGTTSIPMYSTTYTIGSLLATMNNVTLNYTMATEGFTVITMNVLLDTPFGDTDNTIVVGSHLDSVPAGPGINDNGSGSAVNLELAIQLKRSKMKTENAVRFAWWAAEERGLLGSRYYVNTSDSASLSKIAMNINMDMLGSPNGIRGIFNGSAAGPKTFVESGTIQSLFQDAFSEKDLAFQLIEYNNRSDYFPFVEAGIPANGVESGADRVKTPEERHRFGGNANTPYDPCYHQSCDTVDNIDRTLYLQLAKATAQVFETLATKKSLRKYLSNNS